MSSNVGKTFARREMALAGLVSHRSYLPYRSSSSPFFSPISHTPSTINSCTPGYCYLTWFSDFPPTLRNHVINLLGPFPLLRTVLVCLLGLYPGDDLLSGLTFVSDGMAHVDSKTTVWLSDLCSSYLFSSHIRVGAPHHVIFFLASAIPSAIVSAVYVLAGQSNPSFLLPGEREIAETAVTVIRENAATTAGYLSCMASRLFASGGPLRETVTHMVGSVSSLTLSDCIISVLNNCIVYPAVTYWRITMSWPVLSALFLSYFALPYLSRRFPRRGVAVCYCLMIPPVLGLIPAWIIPMCRGLLYYVDDLLPARVPNPVCPPIPALPAPGAAPSSFVRDGLLFLYRPGAPVAVPTNFDSIYDSHNTGGRWCGACFRRRRRSSRPPCRLLSGTVPPEHRPCRRSCG